MRDLDIPEFKMKKFGLGSMLRYWVVVRTVRYLYWCWKEKKYEESV